MDKTRKSIPVYSICTIREAGGGDGGMDLLNADRFGRYLSERGFLFQPHRHSFYHLVYFTRGGGEHSIDFVKFPVRSGQIYFMNPGQVHHWQFSPEEETDGYIINFPRELFHGPPFAGSGPEEFPFFSGHCEEQVIQLSPATQDEAVAIFEKILQETAGNPAFGAAMIRSLLLELFIRVARDTRSGIRGPVYRTDYPILRQFETLVDEHYTRKRLPREYAGLLHVTPNYLNALCTEALGKSAGAVIRERILLEAKRLLVNAGQSISEIAFQLNFPDNSYFSKFFKKYTGYTPEGFRKANQVGIAYN
ncbi:MAG: AraC family transcriptional regulator [Puia sp.]|nr:AraC family transcriptional regulator [Puia sp.]